MSERRSRSVLAAVHDLTNPETGRTYKEDNMLFTHSIPVGTLVEVLPSEEGEWEHDGVRMYVAYHGRDCDGEPLYWLGNGRTSSRWHELPPGMRGWCGGFSEEGLRVVAPASRVHSEDG